MATTLRLTDAEAQMLRERAELERRPVQEVFWQAIRECVERHPLAERCDQAAEEQLLRWAALMRCPRPGGSVG